MKRIKVRFNLGRGKNYMKWKIEHPDKKVTYYSPEEVQLIMYNCTLKNNKKISEKIYNGANKQVCSWVLCEKITISEEIIFDQKDNSVTYNPRVVPNWVYNDKNVDNMFFNQLHTIKNKIYFLQ